MSTKNLSSYNHNKVPDASEMTFGILVSEWNEEVTFALRDGAVKTLIKHGAKEENITIEYVPGTFELTKGANLLLRKNFDAIIALGCVIRGGTPHFDFICQGVTYGLSKINSENASPVIFGVLTTDTQEQAIDRSGGKMGNKGDEAAITAIKMIKLSQKYL